MKRQVLFQAEFGTQVGSQIRQRYPKVRGKKVQKMKKVTHKTGYDFDYEEAGTKTMRYNRLVRSKIHKVNREDGKQLGKTSGSWCDKTN